MNLLRLFVHLGGKAEDAALAKESEPPCRNKEDSNKTTYDGADEKGPCDRPPASNHRSRFLVCDRLSSSRHVYGARSVSRIASATLRCPTAVM